MANFFSKRVVMKYRDLICCATANFILKENYMRDYAKVGGKPGKPGYRTPSAFQAKVFEQVRKIPRGQTLTYKQVAELIGQPKSYRAIGNVLNKNMDPKVPCHRVIRSDGLPGGYNKGLEEKIKILKKEGAI